MKWWNELETCFFLKETPRAAKNHPILKNTFAPWTPAPEILCTFTISNFTLPIFTAETKQVCFFQAKITHPQHFSELDFCCFLASPKNGSKHDSFENPRSLGISRLSCFKIRRFGTVIWGRWKLQIPCNLGPNPLVFWAVLLCCWTTSLGLLAKWNTGWHDEERKFGGDFLMEFEFPELNEFSLVFFEKTVGLNLALTLISTSRTGPCPCRGCDFAYECYKPKFLWRTWEHLQKAHLFLKLIYWDDPPAKIPVTTRISICLVGGSPNHSAF